MDLKKLYEYLEDFLSKDTIYNKEFESIQFQIELQPQSGGISGEYTFEDGSNAPVNLKIIGKSNCYLFLEFLRAFHKTSTDGGRNKWNKVTITKMKTGNFESSFIWDEQKEKEEIMSFQNSEHERGKWYWDE